MRIKKPYQPPRRTLLNEDDTLEVENFKRWMEDVKKFSPSTVRSTISCIKTLILHKADLSLDPRDIYRGINGKSPTRCSLNRMTRTINTYKGYKEYENRD